MKKISFRFNENGNFIRIIINYQSIKFLFALALPFPWYGKHVIPNRFAPPEYGWHIRYKTIIYAV